MKDVSLRTFAFVVIILLALSLPNAFAQDEGEGYEPGENISVDVTCANKSGKVDELQAKVEDPGGLIVKAYGGREVQYIAPGKRGLWKFMVEVPENAAPGTYTVIFECISLRLNAPEVRQKYVVRVRPPEPRDFFREFLEWLYGFFRATHIGELISGVIEEHCVIATAAYGSEMAPEVVYMRYVRDSLIGSTRTGRILVAAFDAFYYLWSPTVASAIANSELLRAVFRVILLPLVAIVHATAIVFTSTKNVVGTADVASVVAFVAAAMMTVAVYVVLPVLGGVKLVQAIRRRPLYKPSIVSRGYSANPEDQGLFCDKSKTFVSLGEEEEEFDD